ncbi:MAG: hypothetical protein JOY80_06165, partial [Candidatus Dormibacteraeota bacterium]|nr:hypothetical protein [Candidatus Dormibacteraeota bacterium]
MSFAQTFRKGQFMFGSQRKTESPVIHRVLVGFGLAALVAACFSTFGSPVAKAASTDPIGFGTPTVMDPLHSYGEPNIGINPVDGSMYDSGPEGTGVQRSGWEGSVDGGASFKVVGQCVNSQTGGIQNTTQPCPIPGGPSAVADQEGPTSAPGGGDAEQRFDHNGTQYFTDLYALACDRVAYTSDDGSTAPESSFGCSSTTPTCASPTTNNITNPSECPGEGSDRPWLAVLDPGLIGQTSIPNEASPPAGFTKYTGPFPVVYEEYNNLQTLQNNCSDWAMSGNPGNPTTNLTYQSANNSSNGNFGCDGYPSVDQETGQILEASTCGAGICLNIATPDSTGFLHFLDDNGGSLITVATADASSAATLFVVSSIDAAQNLHVSWIESGASDTNAPSAGEWQAYTTVASAASGWTNWASPALLSSSNTVNIFPWVVAGDGPECETSAQARVDCAGRSDTSWYGTTDDSEGPSSMTPGKQVWDVYMSQVVWPVNSTTGAYTGGAPLSVQTVKVTPHPMQYGAICLLGTDCITAQGNRNVADFFEVNADSHGAAVLSYDDNSNNLLQPGAPPNVQAADHAGAGIITIARQTNGPGLVGSAPNAAGNDVPAACSASCSWSMATPNYETSVPQTGMNHATGDALVNPAAGHAGTELPAADLVSNHLSLSSDNSTLTVTMNVKSLSTADIQSALSPNPAGDGVAGATYLTYVTRWLEPSAAGAGVCSLPTSTACTLFYAEAEITPAALTALEAGSTASITWAAGTAQSVDLCSVSACFPHVEYYPEAAPAGNALTSGVSFNQSNGQITIQVPSSDVGSPTQSTELEEVGSYTMLAGHLHDAVTNAQAQVDNVPFEVNGLCCFNFQANAALVSTPEAPWTPALILAGVALIGAGTLRR